MSSITIKDLPLNFLLKQDDPYFATTEFTNHVNLFNSLKTNTPLLPVPVSNSGNFDFIPVLVSTLVNKYDFIPSIIDELLHLYIDNSLVVVDSLTQNYLDFFSLQSKKQNKPEEIEVLEMDKSISDFPEDKIIILTRNFEEETKNNIRNNFKSSMTSITISEPASKPSKTNNVLLDVTKLVRFYKEDKNPNVTSQNSLEQIALNSLIKDLISENSSNYSFSTGNTIKYSDVDYHPIDIINMLKNFLLHRYYSDGNFVSVDLSPYEVSFNQLVAENNKSFLKLTDVELKTYTTGGINVTITHNQGVHPSIITVVNTATNMVENLFTTSLTNNSITFTFPSSINARITLFFDKLGNVSNIKKYKKVLNGKNVISKKVKEVTSFNVYASGMDEGFIYEFRDTNNNIVPLDSILVTNTKLEITFSIPVSGEIFIIPTIYFDSSTSKFNLNEDTVVNFLQTKDFIENRYTI